ncbi:MAG: mechanosensitive ion channel family protein [Patescibacteria group bacterium]
MPDVLRDLSDLAADIWNAVASWSINHWDEVAIVVAAAFAASWLSKRFIERLIRRFIRHRTFASEDAERKREDTLIRIFHGTAAAVIWLTALITLLGSFGVEIGALLAAAGVLGVAVGFGAQYVVRDILSGFFVLLENQFGVGDIICVDGKCGLVEDISLRLTTLRDLDGTTHFIPNGEIKIASSLSKDFSRVDLNVGVAYDSDLDHVIKVINRVGKRLSAAAEWKHDILKPPQFLRVDAFGDSAIIMKVLGETKAARQWDVTGELRRRLKIEFDKEGIEIPFPQQTLHGAVATGVATGSGRPTAKKRSARKPAKRKTRTANRR